MSQQSDLLAMVQNLEPALRETMEKVLTPQGTSQVASSPHFSFIICNLINGYSPIEVSRVLLKEKGQHISAFVIREYQVAHIPPELQRTNMQLKWLQRSPGMDEIQILEHALRIQLQKVVEQMDRPQRSVADREGYRRDVELLVKASTASLDAKIKTGRVPRAAGTYAFDGDETPVLKHQHEHTHKVTDGAGKPLEAHRAKNVLAALGEIDKVMDESGSDSESGSN